MSIKVNAIIMKTNQLDKACEFYTQLGLNLEKEQHDDGPVHYTSKLDGVHFGLYALDPWTKEERRARGQETMIGFEVTVLSETFAKLKDLGANVLIEPEEVPWGKRAVVLDPDGRPIELNESPSE